MGWTGRWAKICSIWSLTEQVAESKVIDNNDITHTEELKVSVIKIQTRQGTDQIKEQNRQSKVEELNLKWNTSGPSKVNFGTCTGIAQKAAIEKLFGKRSTYKGPRVTRSYKIEIEIDNWLDNINEATTIEKIIVTEAIREYITAKYPE